MSTDSPARGCDGCNRPNVRAYRFSPDGDDPKGLGFCFLCVKEDERAEAKRCPCGHHTRCAEPRACENNR